ncbi:hypothetical protein [Paracoccus sp. S1E-3]|uniref:hypothetical protein n=1 Tax=Paracoccus sp. S1E-3 TaxID=2756130 RepID=UPI0015EF5ECE|nr:hypothetical protein [Paracoccus sp. S1E-3]MBA4490146.1 hypothetical protein [Paracoccus sp. S1E-3]
MIRPGATLLALALACAAPRAQATPPDFIQIRDEILAVSADTVFVLRNSIDNLGLYEAEVRATALIELDRTTGEPTVFPLYAARWTTNEPGGDDSAPRSVSIPDLTGRIDLFARLGEKGALPIWTSEMDKWSGKTDLQESRVETGSDGQRTIRFKGAAAVDTDIAALEQAAIRGLAAFAARMDYPRFGPMTLADVLSLEPVFPPGCRPEYAFRTRDMTGAQPPTLIRLDCADPERGEDFSASLIVLIPPQTP